MAFLDDWDYSLPDCLIARKPALERSSSRLLYSSRATGEVQHRSFIDLPYLLRSGDLLVVNDTRVMPARLFARRKTGGQVEVLVLDPGGSTGIITAMIRPSRRLSNEEQLTWSEGSSFRLLGRAEDPSLWKLTSERPIQEVMESSGEMPLPPYMERSSEASDRERYQTIFAGPPGAAAAPTAGLHFDSKVLELLEQHRIGIASVTLHVGIGTFRPLKEEDMARGELHREQFHIPSETAERIAETRANGGRIIAVGTTSARTLESVARIDPSMKAESGSTTLFIRPPYTFQAIDGLITNFHLPKSSLLMLVAAFMGKENLFRAYRTAIDEQYRFFSYGDAMLIL